MDGARTAFPRQDRQRSQEPLARPPPPPLAPSPPSPPPPPLPATFRGRFGAASWAASGPFRRRADRTRPSAGTRLYSESCVASPSGDPRVATTARWLGVVVAMWWLWRRWRADSGEKVWEGCGKMGEGLQGPKSHDVTVAAVRRDGPRMMMRLHTEPTETVALVVDSQTMFIKIQRLSRAHKQRVGTPRPTTIWCLKCTPWALQYRLRRRSNCCAAASKKLFQPVCGGGAHSWLSPECHEY